METIKLEDVKITLNALSEQINALNTKKENIISENAEKIQEVINEKVNALADKIKEDAINTVCGKELNLCDFEIEKLNYSKKLLKDLITDEPEQPTEDVNNETINENKEGDNE